MSGFPPCQLCKAVPASCRSHIIPRQFYRRIRGAEKHLLELHVETDIEQRFTQSGIWEQGILCTKCDARLGGYDEYAYDVLPEHVEHGKTKYLAPGATVVELGMIDVVRFKMFLVALVWRASCSTHDLFRFVRIGKWGYRLKCILTGKDTSWLRDIDCAFVHLDPPRYEKLLFPPFQNTYDGVSGVQFYLYPWKLVIKLDKRPFGPELREVALRNGMPTHALVMNTWSQGELRMLTDLQRKIKAHEAGRRRERRNEIQTN